MQENPIYEFLKANNLTDKDEATFTKEYADPTKAKELYDFFSANKLTDKDFESFHSEYFKKKVSGESLQTGAGIGTTDLQTLIPEGTQAKQPTALDLARQAAELSSRTKLETTTSGTGAPTSVVSIDQDALNQANQIKADLNAQGINSDELLSEHQNIPERVYKQKGFDVPTLLKERTEDPQGYTRKMAAARWQANLNDALAAKKASGEIDEQQYNDIKLALTPQYTTRPTYGERRTDTRNAAAAIRQYVDDPALREKMIASLATDRSYTYGSEDETIKKELEADPRKEYLDDNQLRALQLYEDTNPELAAGYNALTFDPKKLGNNPTAVAAYEERAMRLEQAGIALQENNITERLNRLNAKAQGQPLNDTETNELANLTLRSEKLKEAKADLSVKYKNAGLNDAEEITRELIGQETSGIFGGIAWVGAKAGEEVNNTLRGVYTMLSEPFRSDEGSKIHQFEAVGMADRANNGLYVTQEKSTLKSFETKLLPELKAKIDAIVNDKNLSWNEKYEKVFPLIRNNPDQWTKEPVHNSMNITPSSLFYSVGGMAATIAPYLALETATGGGATAGLTRKVMSSFTAALATSFESTYVSAVKEGVPNPYSYALRVSAINAAAMAGAGTPDLIRKMLGSKTAVGEMVAKMTDDEISAALKAESKTLTAFGKEFKIKPVTDLKLLPKAIGKKTLESLKGGAKFEGFMAGGKILNNAISGKESDPEDLGKEALIGVLNFGIFGGISGAFGEYKDLTNMQKDAIFKAGLQPELFTQAAARQLEAGAITKEQFADIKNNIEMAAQIHKRVPFVDNDGKPLDFEKRNQLMWLKMQEHDLEGSVKADMPPALKDKVTRKLEAIQDKVDKIYGGAFVEDIVKPEAKPEQKTDAKTIQYEAPKGVDMSKAVMYFTPKEQKVQEAVNEVKPEAAKEEAPKEDSGIWMKKKGDMIGEKDRNTSRVNNTDAPTENKYKEGDVSIDGLTPQEDGYVYRMEYVDPNKVDYAEKHESEETVKEMPTTKKYAEWYGEGKEPEPITLVFNKPEKKLLSTNRRRLIAARMAGVDKIPAWVEVGKHSDIVKEALDGGKYQQAIKDGKLTASDAKEIIESAGLEVPEDIMKQVKPEAPAKKEAPADAKPGDEVKFKTPGGKELTGKKVVIPGYEGMDAIAVKDGFVTEYYEHTTGKKIADTNELTEEAGIKDIAEQLANNKWSVEKMMAKIHSSEMLSKYGAGENLYNNDSPSYRKYKEKKQAEYDALPFAYTENERQQLRDLAERAKAEGIDAKTFEKNIDRKLQNNDKIGIAPIEEMHALFGRLKEAEEIKRMKENGQPLPDEKKEKLETSRESFTDYIKEMGKSGVHLKKFNELPADLKEGAYKLYKKAREIHNKYGYWNQNIKSDLISLDLVLASMNAKNEKRKTNLPEDFKRLEAAIENIDKLHEQEFGKQEEAPAPKNEGKTYRVHVGDEMLYNTDKVDADGYVHFDNEKDATDFVDEVYDKTGEFLGVEEVKPDLTEKLLADVKAGKLNADDAAIKLDESGTEVSDEVYDKFREAEKNFIKEKNGLQVGDTVTVKGKNGNADFKGNFRGLDKDGKAIVVNEKGYQHAYDKADVSSYEEPKVKEKAPKKKDDGIPYEYDDPKNTGDYTGQPIPSKIDKKVAEEIPDVPTYLWIRQDEYSDKELVKFLGYVKERKGYKEDDFDSPLFYAQYPNGDVVEREYFHIQREPTFKHIQKEFGKEAANEWQDARNGGKVEKKNEGEVFTEPKKAVNFVTKFKNLIPISKKEAKSRIESWKAKAKEMGKTGQNSKRVVISLFDYTGNWAKGYQDAGYTTLHFDIQHAETGKFSGKKPKDLDPDGKDAPFAPGMVNMQDLIGKLKGGSRQEFIGMDLWEGYPHNLLELKKALEAEGYTVEGILAAPPCTSFAASGARWWAEQHDEMPGSFPIDEVIKRYGDMVLRRFDSPLEFSKFLVDVTEEWFRLFNPEFYAMENPKGRIQKEMGLPKANMTFNPNNFGDAYTKETMLWGKFNNELPTANVEATGGSKIHKLSSTQKVERSTTPEGFAYAFFMANHKEARAEENPAETPKPKAAPKPKAEAKQMKAAEPVKESEAVQRQRKVNDLVDRVNIFKKKAKNAKGRAEEINSIRVAAAELGLKFDDRAGRLVNENGKKVQKRNFDAPKNEATDFDANNYSEETRKHIETISGNPTELLTGLPVEGNDGRQLTMKQLEDAVQSIKDGKPTNAAKILYDFVEKAVNDGGVELVDKASGQRAKVPLSDWLEAPVTPEVVEAASKIGDNVAEIIDTEGITLENIDNVKHLFDGFPYTEEDFAAVKQHLSKEGERNDKVEQAGSESKSTEIAAEPADTRPAEERRKEARTEYDKAVRELKSAEDKISKQQATQTGMFGEAAQGSMFGVARDEAKEILDPLRKKVKEAKEKLDSIKDDADPAQPGLFNEAGSGANQLSEMEEVDATSKRTKRIQPAVITGVKPKEISKILLDTTRSLKQRLNFLASRRRRSLGSYTPGNSGIRIRFNNDMDTTAHEIGHALDDRYKIMNTLRNDPAAYAELNKFSGFGSTPPKGHPNPKLYVAGEGFAEWVRAYVVNPDEAKKSAPNVYRIYEQIAPEKLKKAIDEFSYDVRVWAGATGSDMILSNVEVKPESKTLLGRLFNKNESSNAFSLNWVDRLSANFINPFNAFQKAFDYLKDEHGIDKVDPSKDPLVLSRLLLGVDGKVGELLESGMIDAKGKVLKDANGKALTLKWLLEPLDKSTMKTVKKEVSDVIAYMVAERTVELADRFDRNSVLTGIGGGIYSDVSVAEKALREFNANPAKLKRMQEAADRYRQYADSLLQYMVDKGRLSQEQFKEIKANNVQYVALKRIIETEPGQEVVVFKGSGSGRTLASSSNPLHKIKGSTQKIQNPYISLMDTLYKSVKEADRNEALRAFRDLLIDNRGMYNGDPKRLSDIGVLGKQGDRNAIAIYVNGKPEYWVFQKDIYEALKGLDKEAYRLPGLLTAHARILRWTVTNAPTFAMRNWVRDFQDRLIKSNSNKGLSGILNLFGKKEDWKEVARMGGLNSGYYLKDRAYHYGLLREAMDEVSKNGHVVLDAIKLQHWGEKYHNLLYKSEQSNRVAEYRSAYQKAKREGMDDYNASLHAAFQSRDMLDFAVAGHYMKIINQIVPFSNAAVQGLRSTAIRAKENPLGFAMRMVTLSVLPQVAMWYWNHRNDDEGDEYEALPHYQRDLFWNFKLGNNKWMAIPKPYELSLAGAGVDRLLSKQVYGNEKAFDGYGGMVAKTMLPLDESAMTGMFQPVIEILANKDFFRDKNIVPPHEQSLDLSLRHTDKASNLSNFLQDHVGVDARYIDHFIQGQFSYFGNYAIKLSNMTEDDSKQKLGITDLGFFKNSPGYNSAPVQEMVEYAKEWGLTQKPAYKHFNHFAQEYFETTDAARKDAMAKELRKMAEEILKAWKEAGIDKLQQEKRNAKD